MKPASDSSTAAHASGSTVARPAGANPAAAKLCIALVCNTAWAIYTYRQGLIRTLVAAGVELVVLAPRDRTFEPLAAMGCRCIELPVASKGTNPLDDLRTLVALYRHYRTILSRFSVRILSCQTHSPGQHFPTTITTAPGGGCPAP
jgi:hypothetical protein